MSLKEGHFLRLPTAGLHYGKWRNICKEIMFYDSHSFTEVKKMGIRTEEMKDRVGTCDY